MQPVPLLNTIQRSDSSPDTHEAMLHTDCTMTDTGGDKHYPWYAHYFSPLQWSLRFRRVSMCRRSHCGSKPERRHPCGPWCDLLHWLTLFGSLLPACKHLPHDNFVTHQCFAALNVGRPSAYTGPPTQHIRWDQLMAAKIGNSVELTSCMLKVVLSCWKSDPGSHNQLCLSAEKPELRDTAIGLAGGGAAVMGTGGHACIGDPSTKV